MSTNTRSDIWIHFLIFALLHLALLPKNTAGGWLGFFSFFFLFAKQKKSKKKRSLYGLSTSCSCFIFLATCLLPLLMSHLHSICRL